MILKDGQKWACRSCITGHRSSKCTHNDRELFPIAKKGRPSSHCKACREAGRSSSSTDPPPPGCTCEAKRRAKSQAGSAPGSISPDNAAGNIPSSRSGSIAGTSYGTPDSHGSAKRRRNSDGTGSMQSFDDRRGSTSQASSYSEASDYGYSYNNNNSGPSSLTSSPAQMHQTVPQRLPYYYQQQYAMQLNNDSIEAGNAMLPDPRLSATHLYQTGTNQPHHYQPMLPPILPTTAQQQMHLSQGLADGSSGPGYPSRPGTAEEVPWWMYRTGFSPDFQHASTAPPPQPPPTEETGKIQQLVHNHTFGYTDLGQFVEQPSHFPNEAPNRMDFTAPLAWHDNVCAQAAFRHYPDSFPLQSQLDMKQEQRQAPPVLPAPLRMQEHQLYHSNQQDMQPRRSASQLELGQSQAVSYDRPELSRHHDVHEPWVTSADPAPTHHAALLTETPGTWSESTFAGYYPSLPTVKPESFPSGSVASTAAGSASEGVSTTEAGDTDRSRRPSLVDVAGMHSSAPGYIQMGTVGEGVGNMTGDTGHFQRAGFVMNLKLPDKKRKISTEW